jgi:hypothetical protein
MVDNKICIIDPANWCPGLKLIYKNSSYYCHEPDNFFDYSSITRHYTNNKFEEMYGFRYRTDYEEIEVNKNFEIIIIVFPLYDGIENHSFTKQCAVRMLEKMYNIVRKNNNFKKRVMMDLYDYDYDPSLFENQPIDIFLKRNYNKNKNYGKNVFPFPFCMFIHPCLLWKMFTRSKIEIKEKVNKIFWAGGIYTHEDKELGIYRDRRDIFNKIKNYLDAYHYVEPSQFLNKIRTSKLCLDLNGVGDPNYRTFEILYNGSLIIQQKNDLLWPFEEEFPPEECVFTTEKDFLEKTEILLSNEDFYIKTLKKQQNIVDKYLNIEWITNYLNSCIAV